MARAWARGVAFSGARQLALQHRQGCSTRGRSPHPYDARALLAALKLHAHEAKEE